MNFTELPRVGTRNRSHFSEPRRYTSLYIGIGGLVVAAGTSIYSTQQQKKAAQKALDAQRGVAVDIKYEPVDIEKVRAEATAAAIENATNSLNLERQLSPDVAATRTALAKSVREDLDLGGNLSPDVINRVNSAGRTIGARSGNGAGTGVPLTAALLGISSVDLKNQRQQAASSLLGNNPLPLAGLDPGQVASLEVANNAANNQFNLEKAGYSSNLANSEAAARSAQIGGQVGNIAAVGNLIGTGIGAYQNSQAGKGPKISYDDYVKKYGTVTPTYTPVDTKFDFGP